MAKNQVKVTLTVDDKGTAKINKFGGTADREFKKLETRNAALARSFSTLGKSMGPYLAGTAFIGGMGLAIKESMEFEAQLANISTMLDEQTMHYMPRYKQNLKSLAVEYGQATETLSSGLYDILSASVDPARALDVLETSSMAATAGITEVGVAANAVTNVLNAYDLAAEDSELVSDKLFMTVKRGKTNFEELAGSIGNVAPTASAANLSLEELLAMISTVTRKGIRTEEAITAINSALNAFLKPQGKAIDAAAKYGVELTTNTLKSEGLSGVMKKLERASAEELAQIFGNVRGLKAMVSAMGDAQGYAKDLELQHKANGSTLEAYNKQADTNKFRMEQATEATKAMARGFADRLTPAVAGSLEMLTRFGNVVLDISHTDLYESYEKQISRLSNTIAKQSAATISARGKAALDNLNAQLEYTKSAYAELQGWAELGGETLKVETPEIAIPAAAPKIEYANPYERWTEGLVTYQETLLATKLAEDEWTRQINVGMVESSYSAHAQMIDEEQAYWDAIDEMRAEHYEKDRELDENILADRKSRIDAELDYERMKWQYKLGIANSFGSAMLSAAGASSNAIFAVQKAFDLAQTWINTQTSASLALATIPPPLGEVVATKREKMGLWQMAAIAATSIAGMAEKREKGGDVQPRGLYRMGERGDELLVMGEKGGWVIPHDQTRDVLSGRARVEDFLPRASGGPVGSGFNVSDIPRSSVRTERIEHTVRIDRPTFQLNFPEIKNVQDLYKLDRAKFREIFLDVLKDAARKGAVQGVEVITNG